MASLRNLGWAALALLGAACLGVVALRRGESVNAVWIVVASVSIFMTGYRFYARFIGEKALRLDPARPTPAHLRNDGLDYVPTDKSVLFGHHFAAIAGAGPLVGPVLAAQLGYMPGTLWIVIGVLVAGAVQDFVILFLSMRRDGRSLGEMIREELGTAAGLIAMVGILAIMIILLAVLALVVVKALAVSPWGTFTVFATMPIAVLMGFYLRYFRPGKIFEISVVGFALLLLAIWLGGRVAESARFAPMFTFDGRALAWILIGYGFVASVLPVWLLLAPRDYLSTFLKVGTIALLAVAILIVRPQLRMPAVTPFIDGSGPVWSGGVFPFLFITIACGSVSGFHALISSGTTPKMIKSEADARVIGYGAMLMEAFVAIMALIAACALDPGVYFALNAPAGVVGSTVTQAAQTISSWGFTVTPDVLTQTAKDIGETTILARAGGAPTLAIGMAQILHSLAPSGNSAAFWYHYAILFEALFILTTVDAGTRVGRFMIHELLGYAVPSLRRTDSWGANLVATGLCVAAWGYFLYQGVVDPLGGINTLWPLFGISNQMLAGIALTFASVVLLKMKRGRYVWVTAAPMTWLLICTMSAGWQKVFSANVKIGFLSHAAKFSDAIAAGTVMAPAKSLDDMRRVVQNDYVDAALCILFMAVAVSTLGFGAAAAWKAHRANEPTAKETPYDAADAKASAA